MTTAIKPRKLEDIEKDVIEGYGYPFVEIKEKIGARQWVYLLVIMDALFAQRAMAENYTKLLSAVKEIVK